MIGPFIFIDHMGPAQLGPKNYMDVDQHPHIGLSKLTFMLEGESFPEERHIYWNFVFHDKEKIERAKTYWKTKTFPMMKNDDSYVPLPGL